MENSAVYSHESDHAPQPRPTSDRAADSPALPPERHRRLVAVYPGSFDPVTRGHLDIASRAARLVDELVVAVYATPSKSLLFSTAERVDLWRDAIAEAELANARVEAYEGLTTEFARLMGAQAIVRGLRAVSDFEVEFQQALMYRKLAPEIETLMIVTSLRHLFLSSSLLKEVARLGGDLDGLVTARVARALHDKFAR
jgi:pantetheine-phosphate adenylyltransferase